VCGVTSTAHLTKYSSISPAHLVAGGGHLIVGTGGRTCEFFSLEMLIFSPSLVYSPQPLAIYFSPGSMKNLPCQIYSDMLWQYQLQGNDASVCGIYITLYWGYSLTAVSHELPASCKTVATPPSVLRRDVKVGGSCYFGSCEGERPCDESTVFFAVPRTVSGILSKESSIG
jgi:hypothetical protein